VLDNVKFTAITTANIQDSSGTVMAAGTTTVAQWFQGNTYFGSYHHRNSQVADELFSGAAGPTYQQGLNTLPPAKPPGLLANGAIFSKSRPQYNLYTAARTYGGLHDFLDLTRPPRVPVSQKRGWCRGQRSHGRLG
jgi:hypothetical protein